MEGEQQDIKFEKTSQSYATGELQNVTDETFYGDVKVLENSLTKTSKKRIPKIDVETIKFKVLIVGEPFCGKTSLTQKYTTGLFSTKYKSTIGVDFADKLIQWSPSLQISIHLWDLAGQSRLNTQVKAYFRDTDGVLCVYDCTVEKTKDMAIKWKNLVMDKSVNRNNIQNMPPAILIANKSDLMDIPISESGEVSLIDDFSGMLNDYALEAGFIAGMSTSAKTNYGINEAMNMLIRVMLERREKEIKNDIGDNNREGIVSLIPSDSDLMDTDVPLQSRGWCRC